MRDKKEHIIHSGVLSPIKEPQFVINPGRSFVQICQYEQAAFQ